ncbi:hypothetical protein OHQ89_47455 [Streptomyces canus]
MTGQPQGLGMFLPQEGESQVDAFDFAFPAFVFGTGPAVNQVLLDHFQPGDHVGVDPQDGTADAGVLVLAGASVGATAGSEFDLAGVEVVLECGPLVGRGGPVLGLGPQVSAVVEELLVVAGYVFVEDGDVTAGGLQAQVAQEGGADVDGDTVVDEVGRKEASEFVCGEFRGAEAMVGRGEGLAGAAEHACDHVLGDAAAGGVAVALEQERQRFTQLLLRLVSPPYEPDRPAGAGEPTDDLGDHVEQFGGHGDDPLAIGLGRGDHQQSDDLAVGALVLPDAQVAQFQ